MGGRNSIDIAYVKSVLSYNQKTGVLRWTDPSGYKVQPGSVAGYALKRGNIIVMIDGRNYQAHRLAWAMHYGTEPPGTLDHIDGNPSNNRIDNLREATPSQNGGTSRKSRRGLKGAYPMSNHWRWTTKIRAHGVSRYIGSFDTEVEAHEAYRQAAIKLFGEFARFE